MIAVPAIFPPHVIAMARAYAQHDQIAHSLRKLVRVLTVQLKNCLMKTHLQKSLRQRLCLMQATCHHPHLSLKRHYPILGLPELVTQLFQFVCFVHPNI